MIRKLFILIIFSVFFNSCGFNCDYYLNTEIKPLLINGIVISKSGDKCFGEIVIRQGNTIDTLKDICYCAPEDERIWYYIMPNDSLHKEAGSLIVIVFRDGQPTKEFNYPCCSE